MSELSHRGAFRLIYKRRRTKAEQGALQSHMQYCAECRQDAEMAGLFTDQLLLKELPTRPSPQFSAVYREQVARRSRRSQIMKPIHAVGGVAALALLVLAGWFIVRAIPQSAAIDSIPVETVVSVAPETQVTPQGEAAGEQLDEQLIEAVANGEVVLVNQLLNAGANPNTLDNEGNALLPRAAANGQLEIVQHLLDAGADISGPLSSDDVEEGTALVWAAARDHIDVVRLLIANGADLDRPETHYNRSPLFGAAWYNNVEVIKILLESGADPNFHSDWGSGQTPLHYAVTNSSQGAVQALFEGGADIDSQSDVGTTPLMMARDGEILTILLNGGANPDVQDNNGDTALHRAAQSKDKSAVSILIEHGADVTVQNSEDQTALDLAEDEEIAAILREAGATGGTQAETSALDEQLIAAVAAKDVASVERLLDAGASPDARNSSGNPILQQAIQDARFTGNIDIVALLVKSGVDVNAPDQYGNALLPQAAGAGQLEVVQLLLESGADVTGTVRAGSTKGSWLIPGVNESSLSEAVINNHIEIVELLIAYGADVDHAEDGLSRTALHHAAILINPEVIKILLENGADPNLPSDHEDGETPLHFAVERGSSLAARALLEGGADVNAQTELGMTPMMAALIDHNTEGETTIMFLEYGADPNIVESNGNTALHFAAREGRTLDIPILLEHGADVNQQNRIGNTALHQAARGSKTEAVSILLEYGASLDLKNIKDQTPLEIATDDEIIEMLREVGVEE